MTFEENNRKIHISMITCMKMRSFILKYASKIMFYDVNIACYHSSTCTWLMLCVWVDEAP